VQEVLTAAGVDFANTTNPLTDSLINDFQLGSGKDIAGPASDGISNQFSDGKVIRKLSAVGTSIAENLFSGFELSVPDQPWAIAIGASIKEQIMRELAKTFHE
jgi:hypothetical protein